MKNLFAGLLVSLSVVLVQGCVSYRRIVTTNEHGKEVVVDSNIDFSIPEKSRCGRLVKELNRRTLARGDEIGFWENAYSFWELFCHEFVECQQRETAIKYGCSASWYRENMKFYILTPSD